MPSPLELDDPAVQVLWHALRLEGFFPEFHLEHAKKLFPRSAFLLYEEGEALIEQGAAGRDLFVIETGSVAVRQTMGSAAAHLVSLGPGEVLGEIGLLGGGVRTASAAAQGEARVLRLDHRDLDYLIRHNAELSSHLLRLAAERRDRYR